MYTMTPPPGEKSNCFSTLELENQSANFVELPLHTSMTVRKCLLIMITGYLVVTEVGRFWHGIGKLSVL